MIDYRRKEPFFALCGLNCGLCPRYHTDGSSKCPGCGGPDFSEKHPTCAVVTCNKKHDNVEYCFECVGFPCKKYEQTPEIDSFVSYRNVLEDLSKAKKDLKAYLKNLKQKHGYLCDLLKNYNDGKSKGFYCLAVNLLPLNELSKIMKHVDTMIRQRGTDIKTNATEIIVMMKEKGQELGIELILRK